MLGAWFGCGHVPFAPGTAGTIGALPLYVLLRAGGSGCLALGTVVLLPIAIWAADRVASRSGLEDPQHVVIDEVVGVLVTLTAASGWPSAITGVILFRIFDHWKPWPARWAERNLAGGLGIVLDDVIAGGFGALCLLLARALPRIH